jgi:hypothetical protein
MAQTSITTRKLASQIEVISCCYHESGHTLFGLLKHFQVSSVFVNYSEVVEGITHYFWIDKPSFERNLIEHIAMDEVGMAYAGLIGEQLFYKDTCGSSKLPWVLREGSSLDIKAASKTIKEHNLASPGKPRQQLKARTRTNTNLLLTEYWDDLKLISHKLYKVKRLSFEDLKVLLIKKSTKKEFWKKQFREIELLFGDNVPDNEDIRRILESD